MSNQSFADAGNATAPTAGTVLAAVTVDEDWTFEVEVEGWQGTAHFDDLPTNLALYNDGALVTKLLSVDHPSMRCLRLFVGSGKTLEVKVVADAGASSLYAASVTATRVARHVSGA